MVVESEPESLFFGALPPLYRTVVLEEFTESGAFEAVEAEEFVGNELKVAWGLEGDEFAEKGKGRGWAGAAMVATAGFDLKSLAVLEPASSKLVETSFSYMEKLAGVWDSNPDRV